MKRSSKTYAKRILASAFIALISITSYAQSIIEAVIPKGSSFYINQLQAPTYFPKKIYDVLIITNQFIIVKNDTACNLAPYQSLMLHGTVTMSAYHRNDESITSYLTFKNTIGLSKMSMLEEKGITLKGKIYFDDTHSNSMHSTGNINHHFDVLGKAITPLATQGYFLISKYNDSTRIQIQTLRDIPLKIVLDAAS